KQPQPISWLSERIRVYSKTDSKPDTELLIIEFTSPDPEMCVTVTNAIVETYSRLYAMEEAQRSIRLIELLEHERSRRMVILEQLRERLKKTETLDDPVLPKADQRELESQFPQ